MAYKLVKLTELEYHEEIVIALIFKDAQLNSIFAPELKLSQELLITCSKENRLSEGTKTLIRSVFDEVILVKADLISYYKTLAHGEGITISEVKTAEIETPVTIDEPTVSEPVVEKTAESTAEKPKAKEKPKPKAKATPTKELPRRYGKEKILADIQAQGGKATPLQNAMLRVNDLKNVWVNLSARGIKDMCGESEEKLLSDADCRDITSAIKIVEMKLETILKRK